MADSFADRASQDRGPTAARGQGMTCRPAPTLLITDTDLCLDGFVSWVADLGVIVLRHAGPVITPCPLGDKQLLGQINHYVEGEGVRDLIVCGHSQCATLTQPGAEPTTVLRRLSGVNFFTRMLTRMAVAQRAADRGRAAVLNQAKNLCTYRSVHRGVALGVLRVHAWFYMMEAGTAFRFDSKSGWVPLSDGSIALTHDDYIT